MTCWPPALDGSLNGAHLAAAAAAAAANPNAVLFNPYLAAAAAAAASRAVAGAAGGVSGGLSANTAALAALAAAAASSAGGSPATSGSGGGVSAAAAAAATMKDSRWLTLEVCRQYQRKLCSRDENECKFAHPPPHVDVQNGRVICCYDSIKGKCQRRDPPCKYFHPPQHLRELLLQNGRANLILKSMQVQLLQQQFAAQGCQMMPSPTTASALSLAAAAAAAAAAGSPQGTPSGTPGPSGAPQCPTPGSPASSAANAGKLMYPAAPPLNLTPPGMAAAYSILLSQTAIDQSPAAVTDTGLEAAATTQLAQMFNAPKPATDLVAQNCLYPGALYLSVDAAAATGNGTRKRSAAYIAEPSYAALYRGMPTTFLGYPPPPPPQQQFDAQFLAAQSAAAVAASQMGVGLSPYLTPTQINSMAAAASALKAVPPTVSLANGANGLSAAHLAVMATNGMAAAPGTPAKRPALADVHSGMPMFECARGLYTLQPPPQPMVTTMAHPIRHQQPPQPQQQCTPLATRSSADSTKMENGEAEASVVNDGQATTQTAIATAVAQCYPETYIEIPQYGYP